MLSQLFSLISTYIDEEGMLTKPETLFGGAVVNSGVNLVSTYFMG